MQFKQWWVGGSLVLALGGLVGCSGSSDGGDAGGGGGEAATGGSASNGDPCADLCVDASFEGGEATDFGGGVVECLCEGEGENLEQDACSAYCEPLGVAAAYSYLSSQNDDGKVDKCVCDGTQG